MAHNNPNSPNIPYDPLPLTEFHRSSAFNDPPSPHPSGLNTPPDMLPHPDYPASNVPSPRFLAAALHDGSLGNRDSLASQNTFASNAPSARNSSVYALNVRSTPSPDVQYDPYGEPASPGLDSPLYLPEKRAAYVGPSSKYKRKLLFAGAAVAALIVIAAIIVPIYFTVIKPKSAAAVPTSSSGSPASPSSTSSTGSLAVVTGGNGSKVTTEDGTTFIYTNPFGGFWYWDPNDPFNNNAQAQSWIPPLNQTFRFGIDKIYGFVCRWFCYWLLILSFVTALI